LLSRGPESNFHIIPRSAPEAEGTPDVSHFESTRDIDLSAKLASKTLLKERLDVLHNGCRADYD
jgi:hypothetical protein